MTQLINTLIALAMSLLSAGSTEAPAHDHDHGEHASVVVMDAPGIYGADEATTELIERAMDRFADNGLELPELRIYVHTDETSTYMGLYTPSQQRIDIWTVGEWVVLHELAHAWEHAAVSAETRQAFLDFSGKPVWNDWDFEPGERATEDAANAIAFGLRTDPVDLDRATDMDLYKLAGYELLTGTPSPRLP